MVTEEVTPTRTVVFDLETRRLALDVGGWDELKAGKGGISAIVVWDSLSGRHHLYDDTCLDLAVEHLEKADVVLSFNGKEFDVPIVEAVANRKLILPLHLDMLQLAWDAAAKALLRKGGNSLDDLSKRCLGEGKPFNGAHAPYLSDTGQWARLFDYCISDVELTRKLFLYAQDTGGIVGTNGQLLPLDLPPWFKEKVSLTAPSRVGGTKE